MDFQLSDEQKAIKAMAGEFAREQLAPHAEAWDSEAYFPREVLQEAARLGMGGIFAREDVGGSALSRLDAALIFEQLATGCISTSAFLSIHNMVTSLIDHHGSAAQRAHFLPSLVSMDWMASFCLTEPDSGSDAASLKTRAERDGDFYVLNGAKSFISGGGVNDVYLCMVRTSEDKHHGISCVLVEKDTPGFSFGKQEKKMGWRSQPTSMLYFENCRVPVSNRIGEEGDGFRMALNDLNGGRINIAACSLGGALACLQMARQYMGERHQFGKPLKNLQALRFYYADMLTAFETARLMVYRAAEALDRKASDAPRLCAMAKRYATDIAFDISDKTLQIFGGYGYLRDYQIERMFRDLRVHRILEGTNEIMREIIAKSTLDVEFALE